MQLSFRAALLVLLLGVLLVTSVLIGTSAHWNARFAVEYLGAQLLEQASLRIAQHLDQVLQNAITQGDENTNLISERFLDPHDYQRMALFFLGVLKSQPNLSYLSFGSEDGSYWHANRAHGGKLTVQWYIPNQTGGFDLYEAVPTGKGQLNQSLHQENFDRTPPYERPYYLAAKRAGKSTWPETYVFLANNGGFDIPGITRASPVYDDQGKLLGVLTVDFDLFALSHYLSGVKVGAKGYAFLLEYRQDGSRRLIAHPRAPDQLKLTGPSRDGLGQDSMPVEASQDAKVRALVARIPAVWDSVPKGFTAVTFESEGTPWLGGVRPLAGEDRPRWAVGMVVPNEEVFGRIAAMNRFTLIVSFIGFLSVTLVALWISQRFSKPLQWLARETREIANFELEEKVPEPSRIAEIRRLGEATEEMKASLRSFRKYVPAELVRSLLASGQEAVLGGERRKITVFFSDVVNFTTIAEELEPEVLVELLAEYLGVMTREMVAEGATVDKYIGDAIMAFWGAPHEVRDQAWLACLTALTNQHELARLRQRWGAAGHPQLSARIGIHTGEAIVGNFGSENRLDYTAIGDTVNLASRLEGLNKMYSTSILLSQETYAEVEGRVFVRKVDRVSVKGRSGGTLIYELLGFEAEADESQRAWVALYEAGLEEYHSGRFEEAVEAFRKVLRAMPEDGPSRVLLNRAERYRESPPPPGWDGVQVFESK